MSKGEKGYPSRPYRGGHSGKGGAHGAGSGKGSGCAVLVLGAGFLVAAGVEVARAVLS